MSIEVILLHTSSFFLSIALLPVMAWIFKIKFGGNWRSFFLVIATQLVFFLILSEYTWSNVSPAAAILGPGIVAIIIIISSLFGLLLFPIVFFLIERPGRWERAIKRLFFIYAISMLVLLSPILVTLTGITSNVDLYGKVVDIDGNPVSNAVVHLNNCGYIKDNPVTTDLNGIFNAVATCNSYFTISSIYNPDTDTDCQSRFIEPGENLITFDSFQGEEEPHRRPHWINYTRENPYLFTCVWRRINTNNIFSTNSGDVIPDGRPYTITRNGGGNLTIQEGAQHKGFQFFLNLDTSNDSDPETPRSGRLVISSVGGGIQATEARHNFNAAPLQGYHEKVTHEFTSHLGDFNRNYYFHSKGKTHYGAIRIQYNYDKRRNTRRIYVKIWFDTAGSRVILSHTARHKNYLTDDFFF